MQSVIQSPTWEIFQKEWGNEVYRLNEQLFTERKAGPFPYAISSRLEDKFWLDPHYSNKEQKYCFLRLEPISKECFDSIQKFAQQKHLRVIKQPSVNPKQTLLIDLSVGMEEILKSMKPKHRYNIRLAEKKGLECDIYSQDLEKQFNRFWSLHKSTAERQNFRTHPRQYLITLLRTFQKEEMAHLIFIRKGKTDLATMMLITDKDSKTATYLHGGSNELHKNLMAPFLLHQEAMNYSITKDMNLYDFWGTDAILNQETHQWEAQKGKGSYGTTRFKLGFGGRIVEYPGTFDLVLKPFCYIGYSLLRQIRSRKRDFA